MGEFLMVVPAGWTELPADWINPDEMYFSIQTESWQDIENILFGRGELPQGKHVVNARFFELTDIRKFWVLFE